MARILGRIEGSQQRAALAIEDIVTALYEGIHERSADRGGFEHFVKVLKDGHPLSEIIRDFLKSEEYRRRVGLPL